MPRQGYFFSLKRCSLSIKIFFLRLLIPQARPPKECYHPLYHPRTQDHSLSHTCPGDHGHPWPADLDPISPARWTSAFPPLSVQSVRSVKFTWSQCRIGRGPSATILLPYKWTTYCVYNIIISSSKQPAKQASKYPGKKQPKGKRKPEKKRKAHHLAKSANPIIVTQMTLTLLRNG